MMLKFYANGIDGIEMLGMSPFPPICEVKESIPHTEKIATSKSTAKNLGVSGRAG